MNSSSLVSIGNLRISVRYRDSPCSGDITVSVLLAIWSLRLHELALRFRPHDVHLHLAPQLTRWESVARSGRGGLSQFGGDGPSSSSSYLAQMLLRIKQRALGRPQRSARRASRRCMSSGGAVSKRSA